MRNICLKPVEKKVDEVEVYLYYPERCKHFILVTEKTRKVRLIDKKTFARFVKRKSLKLRHMLGVPVGVPNHSSNLCRSYFSVSYNFEIFSLGSKV